MKSKKAQKSFKFLTAACLGFLQVPDVMGRDDLVPGSRYTASRGAALGDAFLPLGEDTAAALFYNPAVIGRIRKPQTEGLNLQFYGNSNYLSSFGITNLGFFGVTGLSSYASTLQKFQGQTHSVGAAILPGFATPYFAMGTLLQSSLSASVNADGTVNYRSRYQLIPAVATGARLAQGIVRVGYSLQWVNQAAGTLKSVSASDPTLGYNQNIAQGSGLSHNAGLALTFPFQYLPSVNVVARNLFGTRYSSQSIYSFSPTPSGTPPDDPMTIDVSLSVQPKIGSGAYMNFVMVDRDVTQRSGVSLLGRMAIGAEFAFRDQFFLRGGWGSGYPSLGVGFRSALGADLSLTWYSEEVGSGYQSVRDTRYFLQYQLRSF